MSNLALHRNETQAIALPLPGPRGGDVQIRPATISDLKFIDDLQKLHSKNLGFMYLAAIEGHIEKGNVLIAEQDRRRVGYSIAQDRYYKRDECGLISQVNVMPGHQRGLIGATLVKEIFNRASLACKLFCCWCAQDLEACYFWESLGFVPLGFRTGSKKGGVNKSPRIHIFWERRIREGDETTPYWMPTETSNGQIKENRIALPIPPGMHWSDPMPVILPGLQGLQGGPEVQGGPDQQSQVSGEKKARVKKPKASAAPMKPQHGLWFAPPAPPAPPKPTKEEIKAQKKAAQAQKPKARNNPELVAKARVLISTYLDRVNANLLLPPGAFGKYDVSRQLPAGGTQSPESAAASAGAGAGAMKLELEQISNTSDVAGLLEAA